ncbi:MAG TPA: Do family serine endopeptidase [Gammaproteobacteria bacterium]|nr:Do family serine endopeptidase [Gammaproteobacteria bacterium]
MTTRWLTDRARSGWLVGAVAGAVLVLAVASVNYTPAAHSAPNAPTVTSGSFADVFEAVSPAVVNIIVTQTETAPTASVYRFNGPQGQGRRGDRADPQDQLEQFFGRFFDMPQQVPQQRRVEGQGSGFVIDPNGYIATNNHVVDHANKIVVTLNDGRKLDATLVGHDAKTDLALIKVNATNLPHVEFASSDAARVGDWVLAIGNPFGLGGTATAGIISARGRHIESGPYDDYLQIDAPINFGNSGGPLFNVSGQVIGINTAIYSPNGGNIGIGFAIPSSQAKAVIKQLRDSGSVERGWLGVQIQDLDDELAASVGIKDGKGALVADVVHDGPAAHGGVQAGDVITRFNDHEIDSARTLSRVVADVSPSSNAKITVWRDGKSRDLTVKLGEQSKGEEIASNVPVGNDGADALGLTLRGLTDQDRAELGVPADVVGALVVAVEPDSAAADKGLQPGDVITRVNQKPVTSAPAAVAALKAAKKDKSHAMLLVRRGDTQRFVALSFS